MHYIGPTQCPSSFIATAATNSEVIKGFLSMAGGGSAAAETLTELLDPDSAAYLGGEIITTLVQSGVSFIANVVKEASKQWYKST